MIVYHGSSTLKNGQVPDGDADSGAFFSLHKEFAKQFGETIHHFEISGSVILDLRDCEHLSLIEESNHLREVLQRVQVDKKTRLPIAFNHSIDLGSLESVKLLTISLGFIGAYFYETNGSISVEVYDPSRLTWVKSEDNHNFSL